MLQGTRNIRIRGSVTTPDENTVTKGKYVLRIRKQLLIICGMAP